MPNREVNLTKRVQTPLGMRYCPVVQSANGRIKPDIVTINGAEERHPEGAYYLEWREGARRVRLSVGKDAQGAAARRLAKEAELNAINNGIAIAPAPSANCRRPLSAAIAEWLAEIKLTKKPKTLTAYSNGLQYFAESCHKQYVEDVERRDLLSFSAYLRDKKELAPQTCYNRFRYVVSFLKWCNIRGLAQKNDWPQFVEEEPEIYEPEELNKLFKLCGAEERLLYGFFLMTGMRDQEVMYCYWSDLNLSACTVRVSHKPDRGWTPKAYKEREVPIPTKLVKALKTWKKQSDKGCTLVFPTSGCKPDTHFLERLKAIAERAGLEPHNFFLHKFRATFATRCLWAGVDLRTVQQWLGHSDMESTMRYLKPARNRAVREKVNEIFA
jgi:integrase/recombinase XerD